jgi:pimeloyl-ACP methyl ester carboxylesterase
MWRAQVEALSPHRRVVAPDLPGHGTRRGERFSLDGALAAIDAAADAACGASGKVVVVGLSLGGYLALAWAARRPDRVAGVVAAACSGRPGGPLTRGWVVLSRLIGALPDHGARLNRTAVARVVPEPGATDLGAGGFALDVMVDALTEVGRTDPRADLAGLGCPVWLVNGRWDHFRIGEPAMRRAAPNARLVVIPGATHLVSLVRPVAFTRVLLDALDEVDASVRQGSGAQGPGPDAADDPGGVRHHDDVVAERLEGQRPDPPRVAAAEVQPVPVEDRT